MRTRGIAHQDTRERILKVARRLVLKQGHEGLSLRAVAKQAGFSPASLYEYFAGKDELLQALAMGASASLAQALRAAAPTNGPSGARDRAALLAIGRAYIAWSKECPEDFLLCFTRLPSRRRGEDESVPDASAYRVLVDAVTRAAAAGAVAARGAKSTERLAYALWAAAHGAAMLQLGHLAGFRADFAAADGAMLEALLAGWGQ
jgi:AcrR family transcriptional regulator